MPTVIHELADAFLRRKQALAERGQAKTKLAGSDYFMPKSAKQDLANRLSVFEQGGLPELLKQGALEMYHNPIVNTAISLTPGAGDVQSGYEAVQSAKEGNWGEAGLNALGVLPFVPALGGMIKSSKKFPETMLGKTELFETGKPVSFDYLRNTEKSPNLGSKFGQDIEPSGRYMSYKDPVVDISNMPKTWESGKAEFNNPLVLNWGEGYGQPTNWKAMLSEHFEGKKGKDLSKAIAKAGYDGIVTVDQYGPSEIIDLSKYIK